MPTIKDLLYKYHQKIDSLDLDLLIAAAIKKPREFVLTHPEYKLKKSQISPCLPAGRNLKSQILRRVKHEPLAYILGRKEFYGLEFKVDKNVLIPRPETEQIVENVLELRPKNTVIIDVGTGSGNIIISLAKNLKGKNTFFATDISSKALNIAKQNAHFYKINGRIKFLHGNLLTPFIKNCKLKIKNFTMIIVANLPYLSQKIYSKVSPDIKNYEPKSALLSNSNGLDHYKKLLKQIVEIKKKCSKLHVLCFMEISPEQKAPIKKTVLTAFPQSKLTFFKDLSGKYRIARIRL